MDVKRLRNPFFSRQRVTDRACFYGRHKELEALYGAIATHQCRSVLLAPTSSKSCAPTIGRSCSTSPSTSGSLSSIMTILDRKGYELSEEDLTRALAHLQAKDILVRSGPQSSLYRFKIDLIRRWISISRPAVAAAAT